MSKLARVCLSLTIAFGVGAGAPSAQALKQAPQARSQKIDEEYTRGSRRRHAGSAHLTELVDHMPASATACRRR